MTKSMQIRILLFNSCVNAEIVGFEVVLNNDRYTDLFSQMSDDDKKFFKTERLDRNNTKITI